MPSADACDACARSAAVIEAVLGQVFLVTAVARIVSLMGSNRDEGPAVAPSPELDATPDPD